MRIFTSDPGDTTSIEVVDEPYPAPLLRTLTSSKRYVAVVPTPTVLRIGVKRAPEPVPVIWRSGGAI